MFGRQRVTMIVLIVSHDIVAPTNRKMPMPMKMIEYEFTLPDGTKRYEFVDPDNDMSMMQQINLGLKLHGAVKAHPVQPSLFDPA